MEHGVYWASNHKDFGFNLCVAPSQIAHPIFWSSGVLEYKSGVKGGEGWVVCLTFKWTRSSIKLRKGVGGWINT
jgi:hypothetical protein